MKLRIGIYTDAVVHRCEAVFSAVSCSCRLHTILLCIYGFRELGVIQNGDQDGSPSHFREGFRIYAGDLEYVSPNVPHCGAS